MSKSEESVTIQKTKIEEYAIQAPGGYWALIAVNEKRGSVSIQADLGSWSYIWRSPGMPLKDFLIQADLSYLVSKFGTGERYFDCDKTKKAIKKDILEARRERDMTQSAARACWEQIEDLDANNHEQAFHQIWCGPLQGYLYLDPYFPIKEEREPTLWRFMKKIWPHFIEELKNEKG